jgi:3-hydroxybutyryl-CoA dehydratase
MTYYIDELKPGMSESFAKTVTERDVELFGEVSGDMNPVHFDEAYARHTVFRGRIAHGMLSVSYLSTVLGMKMPGPGTIFMSASSRFKAPVRIGDTVVTTCTVREINAEKRRVIFDCVCKVGDTTVVEGEAMVMAPSRPKG